MVKRLKELLSPIIGVDAAASVIASYDVIGDIAIIKVPEQAFEYRQAVGSAIMNDNKSIKSVWAQVSPVQGEYRLRELANIAGEDRSVTVHRESGCIFSLDVREVYFSPRLSHERERIASLVGEGERVFNMFAGVGAFSIVIAKRVNNVKVYSAEINEAAYRYMLMNIEQNKLKSTVIPILDDARNIAARLRHGVDRVLMPLPERAMEYYEDAIASLDGSGWIHLYLHVKRIRSEDIIYSAKDKLKPYGGSVESYRIVREVGPSTLQLVFDIKFNSI